jgi:branched-chain amino acid aminotransferase
VGYDVQSDYDVPCGADGAIGAVTARVFKELTDIQYGRTEHPWSVVV